MVMVRAKVVSPNSYGKIELRKALPVDTWATRPNLAEEK